MVRNSDKDLQKLMRGRHYPQNRIIVATVPPLAISPHAGRGFRSLQQACKLRAQAVALQLLKSRITYLPYRARVFLPRHRPRSLPRFLAPVQTPPFPCPRPHEQHNAPPQCSSWLCSFCKCCKPQALMPRCVKGVNLLQWGWAEGTWLGLGRGQGLGLTQHGV